MNLLEKVLQLEQHADEFGFRWENSAQIMAQIISECHEVEEHLLAPGNQEQLQEELGDLLHAVFSLCVFCKLNPAQTLEKTLAKFERRMAAVQQIALEQGLTSLNGYPFVELMRYWDKAKQLVG